MSRRTWPPILRIVGFGKWTAAGWNSARDAREGDRFALQQIDNVIHGRFAFDIGRKRENDFGNIFARDAFQQVFDPQIFGADMIEGRDFAA